MSELILDHPRQTRNKFVALESKKVSKKESGGLGMREGNPTTCMAHWQSDFPVVLVVGAEE